MSKKTIVFTFGRFQPPTTGHGKLFNAVISHAKSVGGEHRIYASQSFDGGRPRAAVKNPLQYNDKIRFLKQMFPQANIVKSGAGINTFMDVLYDLEKRGYKKIHMIVGEDRVEGIQNTVDKYLNTGGENALNLEEFKVVSAGHRDPEATGVEGMSASKLRAAVAANDFKLFKTGMPTGFSGARELFDAIAKGLAKPMKKSKKTINEKAPPDEKAERMISKAKDSFQDRYGDNADSYLYGVAWKQYNKRHGIKTKTRLGEPIMEGAYQHSKGQLKQAIDGSETLIATLKRYLKTAKSAALKAEIENQIEFWKKNIADARVELGESIMDLIEKRKSYEQRQASLMLRQGASGKEVKDTIGRKRTPEGKSGNALFRKALLDAEVPTILHGRSSDYTDEPLPPRIQKHNASRGVPTTLARKAAQANKPVKEERELDEPIMEGGVKSVIEDFIYDLPKEAIEELKVIMKEKYGSSRTNKLIKIRGKYKLPTQVMGYPTVQLINDYFNTYFGAVNEERELDEAGQAKLYRMRQSHGRAWRRGDTEKQTAMGNATYDKQTKEDEKDVKRTGSIFNMRAKRMAGNRKLLGISDSFEVQHQDGVELDEASNTIPDSAIVVTQNLQKKTITFTWYDGNTEKWIEREVPQDEAPGFYTRAGTAMKTRKTDKYGNLLKAPLPDSTAKFEKLAKANEAIAADLIALFSKKPMGTPITIYGTKPNKKDEYELEIVKRMYQGDEAYTVKSSGRFVELRKSPTGLQIVDVKTKRIVLDKGNDATW